MLVEEDIVRKLKERDETAFCLLYDGYAPALYGLILKLTPDKRIATKLVEESFLKFYQQIHSFNIAKDKLFTWMLRITITQCHDNLGLPKETILLKLEEKVSRTTSLPSTKN